MGDREWVLTRGRSEEYQRDWRSKNLSEGRRWIEFRRRRGKVRGSVTSMTPVRLPKSSFPCKIRGIFLRVANLRQALQNRMLTIRQEQMVAFRKAELEKFVDHVSTHVRKFFPKQAEELGREGELALIRYGIERAARYGITGRSDVLKYIDLSILLGRQFDVDPKLPWAGKILVREDFPPAKMAMLMSKARKHMQKV
jgi:hypothetical protein